MPIFENLFLAMEDTKRYEAKVAVALLSLPLMNRRLAFRMMKLLLQVLEEPANNGVLRNNINPLRVGLMLYRLI